MNIRVLDTGEVGIFVKGGGQFFIAIQDVPLLIEFLKDAYIEDDGKKVEPDVRASKDAKPRKG
jgi:hypothetical protein